MKTRWPLKNTTAIRWSEEAWRPRIQFGAGTAVDRPRRLRVVRAHDGHLRWQPGGDAELFSI
jgi:hypothetical protein